MRKRDSLPLAKQIKLKVNENSCSHCTPPLARAAKRRELNKVQGGMGTQAMVAATDGW